jgi:hypothetical protein
MPVTTRTAKRTNKVHHTIRAKVSDRASMERTLELAECRP